MIRATTINVPLILVLFSLVLVQFTSTSAQQIRTSEEAQEIARAFLTKEHGTTTYIMSNTFEQSMSLSKTEGRTIGNLETLNDEHGSTIAYIQNLEPQGFIIVSANHRIRPILGFSFHGQFSTNSGVRNPLASLIVADMRAREKVISSGGKIAMVFSEAVVDTQWGPLLETSWSQGGHFANFVPDILNDPFGRKSAVGCVGTALAQILNYWDKRSYFSILGVTSFGTADSYTYWKFPAYFINIDGDALTYNFATFDEMTSYFQSYSYNNTYEAYLSFAAGIAVHTSYGEQSSANVWKVAAALRDKFQFGSARSTTNLSPWPNYQDKVITNIQNGMPVQAGINNYGFLNGHSVVIDGYRSGSGYFHVNLGWQYSSWYDLPIIEVDPFNAEYNFVAVLVYDILPYQGWNQIGGDQRNSYHAIYDAPINQPERKWRLNVPSGLDIGYKYSHLVIGTGGRIYAALGPNILGDVYHPYVVIYDKYGTREKLIQVTQSNTRINHLSQNSLGEVFFGADMAGPGATDSRVYRLDPRTEEITTIITHNNPDAGIFEHSIKIDRDNYLYFFVEPRLNANYTKFYSTTRTGAIQWSHIFPSSAKFYLTVPAIDEERNRVYLNYYNSDTQKSHLVAFQRTNGSIVFDIELSPSTHDASASAGPPAINSGGTVFLGAFTSLFAYSSTGTKLWEVSFNPAYTNRTPAIGSDGTLYVNYGKLVDEQWRPGFIRALNSSNGSTKWEIALSLTENDIMSEIYSCANNVICYAYRAAGQWRLGGVSDNGTSYVNLWDIQGGGTIAFGPGHTIVSIPPGSENAIWALADQGDRGDPEGLGMDFADNQSPSSPSNPFPPNASSDQDTVSLQLSWSASHPLGHALKYNVFVCALIDSQEAAFIPIANQLTTDSYTLTGLRGGTHYLWTVVATDGQSISQGPIWNFSTIGLSTAIDNKVFGSLPEQYELSQNYPNPFNPMTTIEFSIPKQSFVELIIYDMLGIQVAVLVKQQLSAGNYRTQWIPSENASGVFFYQLQAGAFIETKKIILLR